MAIGDGHSGEGETRYNWDPDVLRVVQQTLNRFPALTANTYQCHPFCGWEQRSVDFWGRAGRGDPLSPKLSQASLHYLFNLPGLPLIRHYILDHLIWTPWGGYGLWAANDHTGNLRHVHVTYAPVPPAG